MSDGANPVISLAEALSKSKGDSKAVSEPEEERNTIPADGLAALEEFFDTSRSSGTQWNALKAMVKMIMEKG